MNPDVERITADNPGPMTLDGTNTYVVGRDPAVVIDPGPEIAEHIEAVRRAADARGGIGTVLLTHDDADHLAGVDLLGVQPPAQQTKRSSRGSPQSPPRVTRPSISLSCSAMPASAAT